MAAISSKVDAGRHRHHLVGLAACSERHLRESPTSVTMTGFQPAFGPHDGKFTGRPKGVVTTTWMWPVRGFI